MLNIAGLWILLNVVLRRFTVGIYIKCFVTYEFIGRFEFNLFSISTCGMMNSTY